MSYLELAKLGKNDWWRYLLSFLLITVMWQLVGGIPLFILIMHVMSDENDATMFDDAAMRFTGIDPIISYLAISFMFIGLLLGLYLAVRLLHDRKFITLITPLSRVDWRRFLQGFGVYFAILLLISAFSFTLHPESMQFNFDAKAFFIFLPLVLILTPIQACTEEFLFRGYIMQGLHLLVRNPWAVAVLSAILFTLPHLANPENSINGWIMPLNYFALGLFLAIITIRDNRLELAMGAHSANNFYAFTIVNYEGSVLESPALFIESTPDPLMTLFVIIGISIVFYLIIFQGLPKLKAR